MDYVKPYGVVDSMLAGGAVKLSLPPRQLLLRGMLAGAYLGIGTSMAVTVAVETGYWIIGSSSFRSDWHWPFCSGRRSSPAVLHSCPARPSPAKKTPAFATSLQTGAGCSWAICLGSTLYAGLFAIALTTAGDAQINAVGTKLIAIAEAKTNYYASHGTSGLLAAFTKGHAV